MYGTRTYWSTCPFNIPVTLAHHMGWIFYLMVAWLYPSAYCDLKKSNGLVLCEEQSRSRENITT